MVFNNKNIIYYYSFPAVNNQIRFIGKVADMYYLNKDFYNRGWERSGSLTIVK